MLLVLRGLPRPHVQMPILDRRGRTVGYADLGYPDARLGIEYDGATHRTSLAADDRRQNQIQLAGVRLLRFTAADVYQRPTEVSKEVRAALPKSA
jgi:very-short-patch-repair endonuclease